MPPSFENIKGNIEYNVPIAPITWFRVGGNADILFRPKDINDLADFLKQCPDDYPIMPLGSASNILVRDGGFKGAIIKLGKDFGEEELLKDNKVKFGAALPDMKASIFLYNNGLTGGEFLRGVPGTIGGALKMNAGAYGSEIKDIFISAEAVTFNGEIKVFNSEDMGFSYRTSTPQNIIYTSAIFKFHNGNKEEIKNKMDKITSARSDTQPIKSRTGGSTFKNPNGHKAWELIDKAGCRGLRVGDAQMSDIHCNFMINLGNATAKDIETLGETVRKKVLKDSGVNLEWEIKIIGDDI